MLRYVLYSVAIGFVVVLVGMLGIGYAQLSGVDVSVTSILLLSVGCVIVLAMCVISFLIWDERRVWEDEKSWGLFCLLCCTIFLAPIGMHQMSPLDQYRFWFAGVLLAAAVIWVVAATFANQPRTARVAVST